MPPSLSYVLAPAHIARHVIGCHLIQETRVRELATSYDAIQLKKRLSLSNGRPATAAPKVTANGTHGRVHLTQGFLSSTYLLNPSPFGL